VQVYVYVCVCVCVCVWCVEVSALCWREERSLCACKSENMCGSIYM